MDIFCLYSGGKDSVYSVIESQRLGHRIIALLNIYPSDDDCLELDSWMYQTAGWCHIPTIARAADIPLLRYKTRGESTCRDLDYAGRHEGDEVEDLASLLREAVLTYPSARGVACGALASGYQRSRVEAAAARAGLLPIALLWGRAPRGLLRDLATSGVDARIIRTAAGPCLPSKQFIGTSVAHRTTRKALRVAHEKFGVHVAGEGGEYETLVLDSPFFSKRLVPIDATVAKESGGCNRENASLCIGALQAVDKTQHELLVGTATVRSDWRFALRALKDGKGELPPLPLLTYTPIPVVPVPLALTSTTTTTATLPTARVPFFELFENETTSTLNSIVMSSLEEQTIAIAIAPALSQASHSRAITTTPLLSPSQFLKHVTPPPSSCVSIFGDQISIAGLHIDTATTTATTTTIDNTKTNKNDGDDDITITVAAKMTTRVIALLRTCLEYHGAALEDVYFLRLWLSDIRDFTSVNAAYAAACGLAVPARVCVQAGGGGLW